MPTLMLKKFQFLCLKAALMFFAFQAKGQSAQDIEKLGNLINDAVFFTKLFVTPATDAAVYQASNSWMNTPQKAELWDLSVGVHANVFLVPKSDRTFTVSNSDFKFFSIPAGNTSVNVQTALGNNDQIPLTGNINGQEVVVKTPEGVNTAFVNYAYVQASLGLWHGTELVMKFSPRVKLTNFDYQVFGAALKHNINQYVSALENNTINLATMISYGREDLGLQFLDAKTPYGNLGLSGLRSIIDTYQLQLNISKQFQNLELATGIIFNTSTFNYQLNGEKGSIENTIPIQSILNQKLTELNTTKSNLLGEISARYPFRRFFFQTTLGFGKFINTNFAIQYQII